jgi:glyoxylase-like metal-dependent hydrolase (beta-lactamase superfamily II)
MTGHWRIGAVTVSKAAEMEIPLPGGGEQSMIPAAYPSEILTMPWLIPDWATEEGLLRLAVQSLLVDTPAARLVVDTCVGNAKQRSSPFFHMLQTDFLATFEKASGWSPDDVDAVVCTHLHTDHVGWNTSLVAGKWVPTFPNARYYIGRAEYEHWCRSLDSGDARQLLADSIQPLFDADVVMLVASDEQILPEVTLFPTPGHTPGHTSVSIDSRGERAVITGDLMHHPCQIGRPHWHSDFDTDPETANRTRRDFLASVADTETIVFGTHFGGPTAGRVVGDGDGYRFVALPAIA